MRKTLKKKLLILLLILITINCNPFEKKDSDKNRAALLSLFALNQRSVSSNTLGEEYSGGSATSFVVNSFAFHTQAPNVTDAAKQSAFTRGHTEFTRIWVAPGAGGGSEARF